MKSFKIVGPASAVTGPKSLNGVYALIAIASGLAFQPDAQAALGGFEVADGYVTVFPLVGGVRTSPIIGAGLDEGKPNGNTGPEVHTYDAGTPNFLNNIPNNTGLWRELATSRGANQTGGTGSNFNLLGDQNGTGDRAYVATHTPANIASTVRLPNGTTVADGGLGAALLAVRSEAQGFSSGDGPPNIQGNPPNEGPYNLRFAYTPDSTDFQGKNPTTLFGNETITMTFIAKINISDTDEVSGIPSPLKLSLVNNANVRPFEMTFGGFISGASISNPAFKIGWTDENNFAYWNGGAWIETAFTFDFRNFDEVSIQMNLETDKVDLFVRRQLTNYVRETVVTDLSFFAPIGTNFGVIGFETFEDPEDGGDTANGVPKTYLDNFVFSVMPPIPEPSAYGMIGAAFLVGLVASRRKRVKR